MWRSLRLFKIHCCASSLNRPRPARLAPIHMLFYTFPATAYLELDKDSPQAKYIYEAFECNASSSGFGFGEFTLDVATPLKMWIDSCRVRHQRQTLCPSSDGSPDTLKSDTVTSDSSAMKTEREQCAQACFDTPDQVIPNLPVGTSSGFAQRGNE